MGLNIDFSAMNKKMEHTSKASACKGTFGAASMSNSMITHTDKSLSEHTGKVIKTYAADKLIASTNSIEYCVHKNYGDKYDAKISECRGFAEANEAIASGRCLGELNNNIQADLAQEYGF